MSGRSIRRPDGGVLLAGALLLCSFLALRYVVPDWMLGLCIAVTLLIDAYLLATLRWEDAYVRLVESRLPVPFWMLATVGVALLSAASMWYFGSPSILSAVFLTALLFVFFFTGTVIPLAVYHRSVVVEEREAAEPLPPVSVIVPAYNEAEGLADCLDSLLATTYPEDRLEVVVVDDGSTDATPDVAERYRERGVTVLHKVNGGKHSALNYGLLAATGEIIVTVDADSVVTPPALRRLVATFQSHPEAGAVAGTVRVMNRDGLLTRCQALEYVVSINTFRRAFDLFGSVPVVPGCLGAYRREALVDRYGYDPDTLAEDFDLTVGILKAGWDVRASGAVVLTTAPSTWRDLYRQRLRWYRGNAMTVLKHADVLVSPESGFLHRFAFPLRLFTMIAIPIGGVIIAGAVVLAVAAGYLAELSVMFLFFLVFQVLVSALVLRLVDEDLGLAAYAPLFVLGYKQFHDYVTVKSLVDVALGRNLRWTVAPPAGESTEPGRPDRSVDEGG